MQSLPNEDLADPTLVLEMLDATAPAWGSSLANVLMATPFPLGRRGCKQGQPKIADVSVMPTWISYKAAAAPATSEASAPAAPIAAAASTAAASSAMVATMAAMPPAGLLAAVQPLRPFRRATCLLPSQPASQPASYLAS